MKPTPDQKRTSRFFMQLLRSRSSPAKLRALGYTLEETDKLTAWIGSGCTKEDALYALEQYRERMARKGAL